MSVSQSACPEDPETHIYIYRCYAVLWQAKAQQAVVVAAHRHCVSVNLIVTQSW